MMTATMPYVSTRRFVAADDRLLRETFASTRTEIFLLDPDVRDMLLDMQYRDQHRRRLVEHPHAERLILTVDGNDAGVLELERSEHGVHIVDLVVRARFRRRGVAVAALRELASTSRVTVDVSVVNVPGRGLCDRLGFHLVTQNGDLLTMSS
jgi:ribosomal protein S18 acetylase RimI-like enzyme